MVFCAIDDYKKKRSFTIPGLIGEIKCPNPEEYCMFAFPRFNEANNCDNKEYCNFNGHCVAGNCICGIGWLGDKCDRKFCPQTLIGGKLVECSGKGSC